MVFAHHGQVDTAVDHLRIARNQLVLWVRGVAETLCITPAQREEALVAWLMERDAQYRNLMKLPQDIRSVNAIFSATPCAACRSTSKALPMRSGWR